MKSPACGMDYRESIRYLDSFVNYESRTKRDDAGLAMKLDRIRRLLDFLGAPHLSLPTILVGGTKGKGSTAAFLASILTAAGYRTGLYMSPHLVSVRERIRIDGESISREDFARCLSSLKPYLDGFPDRRAPETPSFFEILTACALLFFEDREAETAVLEVGLGGRYDATNVTDPVLSVITCIGLEHTEILGGTHAAIAAEKCGIMRARRPVFTATSHGDALGVIEKRAEEIAAPLHRLGREIGLERTRKGITVSLGASAVEGITVPLAGRHQEENAALACAAALWLDAEAGFSLPPETIREGIARTRLAGRIDVLRGGPPPLVVDTAHTPESVRQLFDTLHRLFPGRELHGVFNISRDKALDEIAPLLAGNTKRVHVCPTGNPRTYPPEDLAFRLGRAGVDALVSPSVEEGIRAASAAAGSRGVVAVFGSFFLASLAYASLGHGDE